MALNPLAPVTDYQSMLNRIFWFASAAALGAVCLLRANLPALDAALGRIDFDLLTGTGDHLPIPGGYLLPALGVGLTVRVFRPHGYVSEWLGIRERFEIDVIVAELARRSGVDFDLASDDQWIDERHEIMRRAFYRFTSGNSPQIDEHLVHQALDSWSWFWIGVEVAGLFVLAGFVLVAAGNYQVGAMTIGGALLLASIGLPAIRHQCKRYAIAQVKAIVSDPARAAIVRQAFDWLPPTADAHHRRAA
jgi:hypothetical protein